MSLRPVPFVLLALVLAGCAAKPAAVPSTSIHVFVRDAPAGVSLHERKGDVPLGDPPANALAQLQAFASRDRFEVHTTHYASLNATMVDSIDGLGGQPGPDGKYYFWLLSVDGKASDVGADRVTLKAGDAVEWAYALG